MSIPMKWAYGVTTVPERLWTTLPVTLASLAKAGFDQPRLFLDGRLDGPTDYEGNLACPITQRGDPRIRAWGNWYLALAELYLRDPTANRYALFQDDILVCAGLREYLTATCLQEEGHYWNLITYPENQDLVGAGSPEGWFLSNQMGRGAQGLIFSRPGLLLVLQHAHTVGRAQDCTKGHRNIDGGVISAMRKDRWKEWCHNPSLLGNQDNVASVIGNPVHRCAPATSFRGETWSVLATSCTPLSTASV